MNQHVCSDYRVRYHASWANIVQPQGGQLIFCFPHSCGYGGIGHSLSKHFVLQGFTVLATLLPHEERKHLEHPQIHVFDLDVTCEAEMVPFKEKVEGLTGGRLDVLVNNA